MPSFSLPGTSIGTEEAEAYLIARAEGASRGKAAGILTAHGMSEGYAKRLERTLAASVQIGKVLLGGMGEVEQHGLSWIRSVISAHERPLYEINRLALKQQINGLCFCRRWLLSYRRAAVSGQYSHNIGSAFRRAACVDSG